MVTSLFYYFLSFHVDPVILIPQWEHIPHATSVLTHDLKWRHLLSGLCSTLSSWQNLGLLGDFAWPFRNAVPLSRICEYNESFHFNASVRVISVADLEWSLNTLQGRFTPNLVNLFTPPFTTQCGKPNSRILHLSASPPLCPISVNSATIYLCT